METKVVSSKEFVAPMGLCAARRERERAVSLGAPCVQMVSIEHIVILLWIRVDGH